MNYYPFGLTMAGISDKAAGGLENHKQFNGIEHTTDLNLNQYDAYFRNLDPQIGRWWQVDPKADSLLGLSPYNAMVNNPIGITDPEGDIIKFDENATAEYKFKVLVTAVTLLTKGVGGDLIQIAGSKRTYTLTETSEISSSFTGYTNGSGGIIKWNPNLALYTTNNVKISATTILNHELDHAAGYDKDPEAYNNRKKPQPGNPYENPEEQRVITGMEQKTALAMGEISPGMVTRRDHTAAYAIKTIWPNSTVGTFVPLDGSFLTPVILTMPTKKQKSKN